MLGLSILRSRVAGGFVAARFGLRTNQQRLDVHHHYLEVNMVKRTKQRGGERVSIAYPLDEITNSVPVISYPHHKVHDGDMYQTHTMNLALADDASLDIVFVVREYEAHANFSAAIGGDAYAFLYENTAPVDYGTPLTIWCMNRVANKIATAGAYTAPTHSNIGAELNGSVIPGGSGHPLAAAGGVARTNTEWILHPDRNYLARITNKSGGAVVASMMVQWYEN